MVGGVVRDLDTLRHCVATGDGCIAGVYGSIVDATAFGVLESFAGEPVIAPAGLALRTVRIVVTGLAADVRTWECALSETVFGRLLFGLCGEIAWGYEFVDESLVLAYTICKHAAVVAVIVDAPLDGDDITRLVCGHGFFAPYRAWLIVVDAHASVIAARAAAANFG